MIATLKRISVKKISKKLISQIPTNIITGFLGVGKTTVTLGLAEAAAAFWLSVLVVDLDPQANASTGLAVLGADRTIDDVLSEARAGAALKAVTSSNWPDK